MEIMVLEVWSYVPLATTSRLELTTPHFTDLIVFKSVLAAVVVMYYLPPYNPFPTDETLLVSRFSIAIFIADIQMSPIP